MSLSGCSRVGLTYESGILTGAQAEATIVAAAAVKGRHLNGSLADLLHLSQAVAPLEELWLQRQHAHRGQRGQGGQQRGEPQ